MINTIGCIMFAVMGIILMGGFTVAMIMFINSLR